MTKEKAIYGIMWMQAKNGSTSAERVWVEGEWQETARDSRRQLYNRKSALPHQLPPISRQSMTVLR